MHSSPLSRVAKLTVLVLIFASIFLIAAPEETDGAIGVAIYINMDEIQKTIQVIPGMGGVVTFTGEIHADNLADLNAQVVLITLQATVPDEPDWHVTDIPLLIASQSQSIISFSFSIRVPLSSITSGMDEVRRAIITGSWIFEPGFIQGEVPQTECTIFIGQYYQYTVTSNMPYIQTSPGGEIDVVLEITNQGNGDDIVIVNVHNKEFLAQEGWVVEQKEKRFHLPFQGMIKVPIRIIAPVGWDPWVNDITFVKFMIYSVQAENSQTLVDEERVFYSIYIGQNGVAVPGFEPSLLILAFVIVTMIYVYRRRQ